MPAERNASRQGRPAGHHPGRSPGAAGAASTVLPDPKEPAALAAPQDTTPFGGTALSADFFRELEASRHRVSILEEANRAVHHLLDRIARLSAFAEGLGQRESVADVADLLFAEVQEILPVDCMAVALQDPASGTLRLACVAPPDATEAARREVEAQGASGVIEWATGVRRPIVVPAVCLGNTLVLLPLATARRTVGMVVAATRLPSGAVAQEHLTLGGVVARQAAECIDNLLLAEDLRRQHETTRRAGEEALARRVADLGLLVEAARTVSGSLDRDGALRHLLEAACRHLGVTRAAIVLREPDGRLPMAASVGLPPACSGDTDAAVGAGGLMADVIARAEPMTLPDVSEDPRAPRCPLLRGAGAAAFLGVPLVARERVIGVLSVMGDARRTFTADEVALLTGLGAQGALAIENARLFEDLQRRMAEQEQTLGRLVHSARMASVGLLAGGVAHDINNPLCIISNHLQLLGMRRAQLAPDVQSTLNIIEANVQRIAGSIQSLLAYAGGQPGERCAMDITEATNRVILLLRNHKLYRHLRVSTDFAAQVPPVNLDRAAWEQVVLELLTNAREAMPEGGAVRLAIRRLPQGHPSALPTGADLIEVAVEDEGPGIAPADLPRLFDPFFTTKGMKRGMGLGLRICRDVVREHGGHLRVESDGGAGTRVVVEFPAAPDPAPHRPARGAGPSSAVPTAAAETRARAGDCGETAGVSERGPED